MTYKKFVQRILEKHSTISKENENLLEKIKKEALEKSILLEISKQISSSLKLREVLDLIIDSVKQVIPYDAAGIFLVVARTKKIYPAVFQGYSRQALKKAQLTVGKGLVGVVVREGKGIVVPDISVEPRYIDIRKKTKSEIIVPMILRNKMIGALNLESDKISTFKKEQLDLLTAFASHAAIAIENARLHEEVLKKRELEYDLVTARQIQKAILPKVLPRVEGYSFATLNIPSKAVSGDLYDLTWLNNRRIGITIGDVSGKGTPAAILMASIYSSYKRIMNEQISIAERISHLNEIMCENVLSGTYTTLFFGELDIENKVFTYCNAGHFPPVVIRKNKKVEKLTEGGTVIGFVKEAQYTQAEMKLQTGDILFLYTDGLIEAKNRREELFDLTKVVGLIQRNIDNSVTDLKEKIFQEIKRFVKKSYFDDDLTFVILKVLDRN